MPDMPLRDGNLATKGKAKDFRDTQVLEPGAPTSTPADTAKNTGSQYETGSGKPAGSWGGENAGK